MTQFFQAMKTAIYFVFIVLSIMVISTDSFSFGAANKCKLNVVTVGGRYSSNHAVSISRPSTSLRALKEGAEEKIKELRAELSQLGIIITYYIHILSDF